jgi:DNA repair exonuclease SbcCD ATPase subunit
MNKRRNRPSILIIERKTIFMKRILSLSQEEFDKLIVAGEILNTIKKLLKTKEVDELSPGLFELIKALKATIERIN